MREPTDMGNAEPTVETPEQPALPLQPLGRAVSAIAGGFMGAVVVLVLVGVVARYVVQTSLPWAEEVSRLLLVWLTFMGAAAATFKMSNIRVDTIYGRFPEGRTRIALEVLAISLTVLALAILIWASKDLLLGPSASTISPGSGIQARWTRIALPIASVLMIVFLLAQLRYVLRYRRVLGPDQDQPRDEV